MDDPCPLANPHFEFELGLIGMTREKMRAVAAGLSAEQLFQIPKGFHNNILWNLGHVTVALQVLCYKNSGLPLRVPSYFPPLFAKGTRPSDWTARIDPAEVLLWNADTTAFLREDLHHHVFKTYEPYVTGTGIRLSNISEALSYAAWHEGLHLGVILSQRKLV